ncbi:pyridoxal phosphate-dependent transferase, partial [Gorgonomyces haynaldii]
DFVSNDYLGLARSTALFDSIEREYSRYKQIGSTGSRLLSGNSQESIELESFLSDYHQSESCLLVNSGFDANMGLFSCIGGPDDHILLDELVHASVHVGCRLSKAPHSFFKHNDV